MGKFSDIPLRANGQEVIYSWFNMLRIAGLELQNIFGGGYIQETSFNLNQEQATFITIDGLLLSSSSYKSGVVFAEIRRKTDQHESVSNIKMSLRYYDNSTDWQIDVDEQGDATGITFHITSSGQVQYKADIIAGGNHTGTIKFKLMSFEA